MIRLLPYAHVEEIAKSLANTQAENVNLREQLRAAALKPPEAPAPTERRAAFSAVLPFIVGVGLAGMAAMYVTADRSSRWDKRSSSLREELKEAAQKSVAIEDGRLKQERFYDARLKTTDLVVLKASLHNFDGKNITDPIFSSFSAVKLKYLYLELVLARTAYPPVQNAESLKLDVRVIEPNGVLSKGNGSGTGSNRVGYSFSHSELIADQGTIYLGWGNARGGSYKPGDYRFQVWYKDRILVEMSVLLY